MEVVIWIVIMIVVALVKGLGQLKGGAQAEGAEPQSQPTAPARRVKPRGRKPAAREPARPVPTPRRGTGAPPPVQPPAREKATRPWQAPMEQLHEFLERLEQPAPEPPPVLATPPPKRTVGAVAAQAAARPVAPPEARPTPTTSRQQTRGSIWGEALRDKQNIRNIIIAAEIIGPPRSRLL